MKTLMKQLCLLLVLEHCMNMHAVADNPVDRRAKSSGSYSITVSAGWNLLSLPATVANGTKNTLFPSATSPAFIYEDGYHSKDTLENGYGFWLKFSSPQTIVIEGDAVQQGLVALHEGWNLIGSTSAAIPVTTILTEPSRIIISNYFSYEPPGGYQKTDTIQPGRGYWVKVDRSGSLLMDAGAGVGNGGISDGARSIVLDSISAHIDGLPGIDPVEDGVTLLEYLRTLSEFAASDSVAGGVWGRFTDGRMFIYSYNLDPPDSVGASAPQKAQTQDPIESTDRPMDALPVHTDAWIVNALGPNFDPFVGAGPSSTVNDLRQWHQSVGYTLPSNAGATVGDLKFVSNVGVFTISTHACYAFDSSGNSVYGLWTATIKNPFYEALYRDDFKNDRLVYFSARHESGGLFGSPRSEMHYAITSKFVRRYMNFLPGAVVYMSACGSFDSEFKDACIAKGADFYLGWENAVQGRHALRAVRHFFDRMLGTNMENPEHPPQRPFDADLVVEDLILKGYDRSSTARWGPAQLKFEPIIPYTNLLAPSILQCYRSPIPGETDFYIDGLFGDDPGTGAAVVKVGNSTLGIREWVNSTKLRLDPPTQGGNVVVNVRGRKSNAVQYTQWHGVFDYTVTGRGSLKKHVIMNVDFLADVHSFRLNIAQAPRYPFSRIVQVLNTSSATYECSGEYRNPKDTSFVEEWWGGSGTVPIGDTDPGWTFNTTIDSIGRQFDMFLTFTAPYTNTGSSQKLSLEFGFYQLTTTMNSSYAILGGDLPGGSGDYTGRLRWSDMLPTDPPDPNGAR